LNRTSAPSNLEPLKRILRIQLETPNRPMLFRSFARRSYSFPEGSDLSYLAGRTNRVAEQSIHSEAVLCLICRFLKMPFGVRRLGRLSGAASLGQFGSRVPFRTHCGRFLFDKPSHHRPLKRGNAPAYPHTSDSLLGRKAFSSIPTTNFWFRPTFTSALRSTSLSSR
jgi:hypothetical protein